MGAEITIRLESVRNETAEFPDAACEVGAHEYDKLIAGIRVHPHAILEPHKAHSGKEPPQPVPDSAALLPYIKDQHAPLTIPPDLLDNTVFPHEDSLDAFFTGRRESEK